MDQEKGPNSALPSVMNDFLIGSCAEELMVQYCGATGLLSYTALAFSFFMDQLCRNLDVEIAITWRPSLQAR